MKFVLIARRYLQRIRNKRRAASFVLLVIILLVLGNRKPSPQSLPPHLAQLTPVPPTETPTPTPFVTFIEPPIPVKDVYRIALVGDSMTAALGPHGGPFSEYMNQEYKKEANAGIIVDNYAVPSTNIETLGKRFTEPLEIDHTMYPALRDRKDLDLIIIESFAYNPLSHLSAKDSELEHHRHLRDFLEHVAKELPATRVALMATIAPNSSRYAMGVENLSADDRKLQVAERITYLRRQIELGGMYAIPVINVFAETLTQNGDGNLRYINPSDYIHPSADGIELISRTMTQFIAHQQILPFAIVPR